MITEDLEKTTASQARELAFSEFLADATTVITTAFASDISRATFLKILTSLWTLKTSFSLAEKAATTAQIDRLAAQVSLSNGQQISEAHTVFLSKATELITIFFTTKKNHEDCRDLAKILFRIKEGFEKNRLPVSELEIMIGGKEVQTSQPMLELVLASLSTQEQRTSGIKKQQLLVSPTIIPKLFLLKKTVKTDNVTNSRKQFMLVGSLALEKRYGIRSSDLTFAATTSPNSA